MKPADYINRFIEVRKISDLFEENRTPTKIKVGDTFKGRVVDFDNSKLILKEKKLLFPKTYKFNLVGGYLDTTQRFVTGTGIYEIKLINN